MIEKLESKKFLSPTEIYSAPLALKSGTLTSADHALQILEKFEFRQRSSEQPLLAGDYRQLSKQQCLDSWGLTAETCIEIQHTDRHNYLLVFRTPAELTQVYKDKQKTSELTFPSTLLAQYIGTEPVLHQAVSLSQTPRYCPEAVMAIEDQQFLEHKGVSVKGVFRAFSRNIIEGRKAQGGSTITQQLVKNYFLNSEKTYSRKAREMAMALLLETRFSKDQILETYLNIIYMGQSGAYQVKGFKSAARFYFDKDLEKLELTECALLAAIINSPGLYNPFKNPERALQRRNLVLRKMAELQLITESEKRKAEQTPLPSKKPTLAAETAPYYVDAVRKQVQDLGIPWSGLRIETGLQLQAQAWAQEAMLKRIEELEKKNKLIQLQKSKGNNLQGVVLSGDPKTGLIEVAVGGRNFRNTQYNRAVDSRRQVGSTFKPFVYLTAFQQGQKLENTIEDKAFTYKWQNQKWSPANYDNKFHGIVTLEDALAQSYNIPAAKIGIEVGLKNVILTAREFGITAPMQEVPALTLGAFEIAQTEMLKAYMGLSQMGQIPTLSFIRTISDSNGSILWEHKPQIHTFTHPEAVAMTVKGLLKAASDGTSAAIRRTQFAWVAAGKTGTTSDYKDAWFVGFTPDRTALVWLGYDNNAPHRLTGGGAPLGIWLDFMNQQMRQWPHRDFDWPKF